jgi:hypothetical protein
MHEEAMHIKNTIEKIEVKGRVVLLSTIRQGEVGCPKEMYRILGATIIPMVGDSLFFGEPALENLDGSYRGGEGYILMDGNRFPYRRITSGDLVQNWVSEECL